MSAPEVDPQQYAYFVSKFGQLEADELRDYSLRIDELSSEASTALVSVLRAKGLPHSPQEVEALRQTTAPTPKQELQAKVDLATAQQSKRAKHVEWLFTAQGLAFSFSLLGPQGLRAHFLVWLWGSALISFIAWYLGKKYMDRYFSSVADTSTVHADLGQKLFLLYLGILASAFAGVVLASLLRLCLTPRSS